MPLLQTVKRVADEKFLGDLTFKFNAVGSIPSHKLSSFESPAYRSILYSASVRPQGPTPIWGQYCAPIDSLGDKKNSGVGLHAFQLVDAPSVGRQRFIERLALAFAHLVDEIFLETDLCRMRPFS